MSHRAHLRALLASACLALAPAARAAGFSTTNVQVLQGYDFDDPLYYTGGVMTTMTLNHFSTWEYGDQFFFADLYRGKLKNGFDPAHPPSRVADLYAEWHPRLFVDRLLGQKDPMLGIVRHWGIATEINQGHDYYAYLAGIGFDLEVPAGWVAGLNIYYRYDRFAGDQWQLSPFWTVPFALGKVPFLFTGFVDVNGVKDLSGKQFTEIWAQPELLVDVLAPFGGKPGKLFVGTEWWFHRHFVHTSSVPQAMVQWTLF
jgi:nucleoside-specific outer membrane channel protein Tsx